MPASFSNTLYYCYRQLSVKNRPVYTALLRGLLDMESEIVVPGGTFDMISQMTNLIMADHPEIFWFEGAGTMSQRGSRVSFLPKYTMGKLTKSTREKKLEQIAGEVAARASSCRSSVEKLELAFNWLVRNVRYVENSPDNQNICSAMINHRSVCAGYSRSLQYLLHRMGIECLYVSGTAAGRGSHAWNIVSLNGKYYHTDVTFGDRSFTDGTAVGNGLPAELEAEYGYLCMSDEEAFRSRKMAAPPGVKLPACRDSGMSWYRRKGLCFRTAEEAWEDIGRRLAARQRYWCCRFETRAAYDSFRNGVTKGRFADLALEKMKLRSVRTSTSSNDSLRIVVGWLR